MTYDLEEQTVELSAAVRRALLQHLGFCPTEKVPEGGLVSYSAQGLTVKQSAYGAQVTGYQGIDPWTDVTAIYTEFASAQIACGPQQIATLAQALADKAALAGKTSEFAQGIDGLDRLHNGWMRDLIEEQVLLDASGRPASHSRCRGVGTMPVARVRAEVLAQAEAILGIHREPAA